MKVLYFPLGKLVVVYRNTDTAVIEWLKENSLHDGLFSHAARWDTDLDDPKFLEFLLKFGDG